MTEKKPKTHQSRFLEAPLVRQADGELKKCSFGKDFTSLRALTDPHGHFSPWTLKSYLDLTIWDISFFSFFPSFINKINKRHD